MTASPLLPKETEEAIEQTLTHFVNQLHLIETEIGWEKVAENQQDAEQAIRNLIIEGRIAELETINLDGGGNLVTWAGDGKVKLLYDRVDALRAALGEKQ